MIGSRVLASALRKTNVLATGARSLASASASISGKEKEKEKSSTDSTDSWKQSASSSDSSAAKGKDGESSWKSSGSSKDSKDKSACDSSASSWKQSGKDSDCNWKQSGKKDDASSGGNSQWNQSATGGATGSYGGSSSPSKDDSSSSSNRNVSYGSSGSSLNASRGYGDRDSSNKAESNDYADGAAAYNRQPQQQQQQSRNNYGEQRVGGFGDRSQDSAKLDTWQMEAVEGDRRWQSQSPNRGPGFTGSRKDDQEYGRSYSSPSYRPSPKRDETRYGSGMSEERGYGTSGPYEGQSSGWGSQSYQGSSPQSGWYNSGMNQSNNPNYDSEPARNWSQQQYQNPSNQGFGANSRSWGVSDREHRQNWTSGGRRDMGQPSGLLGSLGRSSSSYGDGGDPQQQWQYNPQQSHYYPQSQSGASGSGWNQQSGRWLGQGSGYQGGQYDEPNFASSQQYRDSLQRGELQGDGYGQSGSGSSARGYGAGSQYRQEERGVNYTSRRFYPSPSGDYGQAHRYGSSEVNDRADQSGYGGSATYGMPAGESLRGGIQDKRRDRYTSSGQDSYSQQQSGQNYAQDSQGSLRQSRASDYQQQQRGLKEGQNTNDFGENQQSQSANQSANQQSQSANQQSRWSSSSNRDEQDHSQDTLVDKVKDKAGDVLEKVEDIASSAWSKISGQSKDKNDSADAVKKSYQLK
ncbi:hypothetical protein BV898_17606 [Hypsibius exemplaris]|uniref:Uncharacterized protein n=1 Tax=Hypsibius exemplaris TaxID=2072580 RepID=A0A9X6NFE2_HYPEX|nr:hypothetical protein BV898_17606 [Hypsibius exemplaris]